MFINIIWELYLLTVRSQTTNPLDDRFAHRRLSFLLRLDSKKLHKWLQRRSLSHRDTYAANNAVTFASWIRISSSF